jgi:hypothetical protein
MGEQEADAKEREEPVAGLDFVVLDEAAFMEQSVWLQIVRPMLLERRGGALFLSTPFGRNWFWELSRLASDNEEGEVDG